MDKIFIEKASGKKHRPAGTKKLLKSVREGDTLYIESISRLARSTRDLFQIVEQLRQKNVDLVSLKEHIDTNTPQGKFMLTVFAALAELERENTLQRQTEGIAAAKLKGKHLGRPRAEYPDNWNAVYKDWQADKITAVQAMKTLKLTKSTFYKLVRKYKT